MPSKHVEELTRQINKIETKLTELQTDAVWLKRIVIGAASLGFLGKLAALLMGRP